MGLLDMIIGWCFFPQIWSLLSAISRKGVFFLFRRALLRPFLAGAFFYFIFCHFPLNGHTWSTKVISGTDFFEK